MRRWREKTEDDRATSELESAARNERVLNEVITRMSVREV
jgi:hypothetical protein